MRTTITIDDDLLADARKYSGINEVGPLVRAGLKMLVEWEASRRMALMGGTQKGVAFDAPRRRLPPADDAE